MDPTPPGDGSAPIVGVNISDTGGGGNLNITINFRDDVPPEIDTVVSANGVSLIPDDLVSDELLEDAILTLNGEGVPAKQEATPALAGFRLVNTKDPSQPEGQGELIKDSTTGFVVPAEMGLDFTFTAVPESPCVTAVQFLLFDKGTFIDWDTFRDPPYLEKAVKGSNAFKAFGAAGGNGGKPAAFARGAHEAIAGPGVFTLAAIPFNDETEGKDIEVTFEVSAGQQSEEFLEGPK
ncbi:unnamed protein product [Vitrella brassicaformis CCMP3155]|uniref:Uncharacterized protein n=1 Tax=Vitrella brassicaformis (strain CCMP3155) TaxID=1169540 RepID=A0A0G4GYF4_VITBC|nr:unnamed protein product [Vitrella brassicaformis CCMP3155]|eukprot:CEM36011.1 unnamed protein product [Vitrella brassicaformis CCMP3155]